MKTSLRNWGIASLIMVLMLLGISTTQAEEITSKARVIRHLTKVEFIPVGDVKGHVVGVSERSGLAILESGEVATTTSKATFDSTKGSGTHQGYALYKFDDGSTYVSKYQGAHTATGGGRNTFKGTFEYISGTGRFEGIKGKSTYPGKRYILGKEGGDFIADTVGTYTLSSK